MTKIRDLGINAMPAMMHPTEEGCDNSNCTSKTSGGGCPNSNCTSKTGEGCPTSACTVTTSKSAVRYGLNSADVAQLRQQLTATMAQFA